MQRKLLAVAVCALVAILLTSVGMTATAAGDDPGDAPQRMIIKVCNWDGIVPEPALDGFKMPKGKWVDFQNNGWTVESYIVAPNAPGSQNGLYAVLSK
jgi:hypothetical protein